MHSSNPRPGKKHSVRLLAPSASSPILLGECDSYTGRHGSVVVGYMGRVSLER
jgi:hypothetical protein